MPKIYMMGCTFDSLSMAETVRIINASIKGQKLLQHCVVNVAKIVHMARDPELKVAVESCDIVNIDGMGVVFGARLLGYDVKERVAGIDLFHNLLALSQDEDYPVFFLGARADVVKQAAFAVQGKYPKLIIAGCHHGYFSGREQEVVDQVRGSGARLLFVAMTSPIKEKFIARWGAALGVHFVMGVGGTFDVVAGKVHRAPPWLQKIGFEWFYRALQEPRRLLGRYLKTNVIFFGLLSRELLNRIMCNAKKVR